MRKLFKIYSKKQNQYYMVLVLLKRCASTYWVIQEDQLMQECLKADGFWLANGDHVVQLMSLGQPNWSNGFGVISIFSQDSGMAQGKATFACCSDIHGLQTMKPQGQQFN